MFGAGLNTRRNAALFLLAAAIAAGCASDKQYRDGIALVEEGRVEEGLTKLEQASKASPDNMTYRAAVKRNRDQAANRLLAAANGERAAGHSDAAKGIYERVLRIDPGNASAEEGIALMEMDRRHGTMLEEAQGLFKNGDAEAARALLKPILIENPRHGQALILQRQIDERSDKEQMAGPSLKMKFKKPVTLQFRDANVKMVFEALSRTSGINVVLDKDVKPELKTSIFVKDISVEDTIDMILLQNQLEKKVISDNTVFIYPNLPAKIKDYQDLKIRSFHLTNADPKQVLTMLKTLLKTKDVFIHEKTNSIVMRDTPDAIRLAEKLISDQDIADPEVMLEVEVLEVSRTRLSQLGIDYPSQMTFTALGGGAAAAAAATTTTSTNGTGGSTTPAAGTSAFTLNDLRNINGSRIGISPAVSATINMKLQDGDANILASPRIRVRNREKAKVMIGDRVPVITNAITPVSTGSPVVTGSVQYLDVGLKLEAEPDIHLDNEVTIKLNLDVSSIIQSITNPVSGTLAYQIGTRNATTVLRLKDGETQILAGLINDEDRQTANKVPGLGQSPILGRLFSSHGDDMKKTEIVLSITPRIVGTPRLPDVRESEYWTGSESSLRSTYHGMKPGGKVAVSAPGNSVAARALPAPLAALPPAATAQSALVSQPLVLAWQGPSQAKVGDRLSVTLNTPSGQGVSALDLQLNYDPKVFRPFNVVEGNLLKRGGGQSRFNKTVDPEHGQIMVDMSGDAPGEAGPAQVVTLGLEVIGANPQASVSVGRMTSSGGGGEAKSFPAPEPLVISVVQ